MKKIIWTFLAIVGTVFYLLIKPFITVYAYIQNKIFLRRWSKIHEGIFLLGKEKKIEQAISEVIKLKKITKNKYGINNSFYYEANKIYANIFYETNQYLQAVPELENNLELLNEYFPDEAEEKINDSI